MYTPDSYDAYLYDRGQIGAPGEPDPGDEDDARYLARERDDAARSSDADVLDNIADLLTYPNHPALPVWRDEARHRGLVLP